MHTYLLTVVWVIQVGYKPILFSLNNSDRLAAANLALCNFFNYSLETLMSSLISVTCVTFKIFDDGIMLENYDVITILLING